MEVSGVNNPARGGGSHVCMRVCASVLSGSSFLSPDDQCTKCHLQQEREKRSALIEMRILSLALLSLYSVGASFYEELLLRPLEDSKVLAHFQFDMETGKGPHFTLFPKSLGQILER